MLDAPQIVDSVARLTAVIRLTIPRHEIHRVMGPAIGEVFAAVAAQGLAPVGPVFSHHFVMNPDTFDFEVGVPVASPVAPAGRVRPSRLPATRVARTTYHGPYEGLGAAWGEESVGVLRGRARVEPRPGHLADRVEPAVARLTVGPGGRGSLASRHGLPGDRGGAYSANGRPRFSGRPAFLTPHRNRRVSPQYFGCFS